MTLAGYGVTIEHYKSYAAPGGGIPTIKPINVIVGRNNSGKSAIIDAVSLACTGTPAPTNHRHGASDARLLIHKRLTDEDIIAVVNNRQVVKLLRGSTISYAVTSTQKLQYISNNFPPTSNYNFDWQQIHRQLTVNAGNPFLKLVTARLSAERDVIPEPYVAEWGISSNGSGLTRTIAHLLNKADQPGHLVEEIMLQHLNRIFFPDAQFDRISAQDQGNWEIYLHEKNSGRVALSHSGSGLKTVLLVIAYTIILPHINRRPASDFIYLFEELENNLHPALQRRLLDYIKDFTIENSCTSIMTTHSSAFIDMFSRDENASIVHVQKNSNTATSSAISTYIEHNSIIDDLDVRASDLLQSNGIVWVEGPSDRLYFNRWIELWTGGGLREGTHYQCMFYGGRLLSHLTAEFPDIDTAELIRILLINRNSAIIMDSDKRGNSSPVNATKKRVVGEMDKHGVGWITKGREIENYIPASAIKSLLSLSEFEFSQYESLGEALNRAGLNREREKFERKKHLFAERIVPFLTHDNLRNVFDLNHKINTCVSAINRWNGLN